MTCQSARRLSQVQLHLIYLSNAVLLLALFLHLFASFKRSSGFSSVETFQQFFVCLDLDFHTLTI